MNEQIISFKTAKLAKKKGFNYDVRFKYDLNTKEYYLSGFRDCNGWRQKPFNWNHSDYKDSDKFISAPTQSLLLKWLIDEHKILVQVDIEDWSTWKYCILGEDCMAPICILKSNIYPEYNSYEEALEKGLFEALKFIK